MIKKEKRAVSIPDGAQQAKDPLQAIEIGTADNAISDGSRFDKKKNEKNETMIVAIPAIRPENREIARRFLVTSANSAVIKVQRRLVQPSTRSPMLYTIP